ncbi:MAG: hypothetical protein ABIJ52_11890 [Pseudomonadota bacterium]|nr:hypothetical protein [Pseudomonadota bacterium]
MAKIADGNVEVYIKQLISEALGNKVDLQNQSTDEKLLEDENFKLIYKRLNEKARDKKEVLNAS